MNYINKSILFLATLIITVGCNKCDDLLYVTPPGDVIVEFLDADTNENLFTNGTYQQEDIVVYSVSENADARFSFNIIRNVIEVGITSWETESLSYNISIPNQFEFILQIEVERVDEDCNDFTKVNALSSNNYLFEANPQSSSIKIFIKQ